MPIVNPKPARKLHLEALRILASFLVLFNHTGEQGFFLFAAYPPQHPAYWLYLALSIACKAAVPIFFMVSGALLLEDSREEPLRVLFRKRILRTALLLVLISLVYYLWQRVLWDAPASLPEFLELLYAGRIITPLWYLYAYLGFLLALPLLRRLARALGNREFFYWAALALLFQGLLPTLNVWLWKEQAPTCGLSLGWLLEQAVFYPCLGYFAEHRLQQTQLTRRRIALLWLGSLAGIAISALLTARAAQQSGICTEAASQGFFSCFTPLLAFTLYLTARKRLGQKQAQTRGGRLLCALGGSTLGIYLLHVLLMNQPPLSTLVATLTARGCNPMLAILLFCAIVWLAGCALSLLAKRLPGLKKLL